MKNKTIKILIIILLLIAITNMFCINSYASGLSDVVSGGKGFLEASDSTVKINENVGKIASSDIYNMLLMISFVVVAVVGVILGIKFMSTDAENKADAKKSLVIFLIGCIVIYGSFGIWKIVVTFMQTI